MSRHLPGQIELIVMYRTSGGRTAPHTGYGEIVQVIEDGERREPKIVQTRVAYHWLRTHGYEPVEFAWIDMAGYSRRRRETYKRIDVQDNAQNEE